MEEEQRKYLHFKNLAELDNKGENRFQLLKSELEAIAETLQSKYSGRLVVERCVPKEEDMAYLDWQDLRKPVIEAERGLEHPFLAIKEVTKDRSILGFAKKEKQRLVMAFGEVFKGEEDYARQLDVLVADEAAEKGLRAYSQRIAEDHGLTGISIERMQ